MRMPRELHDKIVQTAHHGGRSLSAEVQHRLEQAYAGEQRYGGAR